MQQLSYSLPGRQQHSLYIFGNTLPWAMVTPAKRLLNFSSFLMASCRWRGVILVFLLSFAAYFLPTPKLEQLSIPSQLRGRLVHLHQLIRYIVAFTQQSMNAASDPWGPSLALYLDVSSFSRHAEGGRYSSSCRTKQMPVEIYSCCVAAGYKHPPI